MLPALYSIRATDTASVHSTHSALDCKVQLNVVLPVTFSLNCYVNHSVRCTVGEHKFDTSNQVH